jgi:hypothetical protein
MANPNTPMGLVPRRYLSGAPYNGAANQYSHASGNGVAIFIGDLVTIAGTSQTIDGVVYPDVVQSATGDVFQGVVVGVIPITQSSAIYCEASTQRILLVADDPNLVFEAQDASGGTPLTANDIGLNINVVVGSGSTVTGQSGMELNNGTEATDLALDLKITGFVNAPDNTAGIANAKYFVRINRHRFANQIVGV